RIEQLNAITRLLIYIVIILIIFGFSHDLCTIPIILIIFVVILYYSYLNDPKGKMKEDKITKTAIENYTSNADVNYEGNPQAELESGYYDSDENLIIGPEYSVHTKRGQDLAYTYDEFADFKKKTCQK